MILLVMPHSGIAIMIFVITLYKKILVNCNHIKSCGAFVLLLPFDMNLTGRIHQCNAMNLIFEDFHLKLDKY
jgi:hypothetical protein